MRISSSKYRPFAFGLCVAVLLAGCKREPAELPGAATEPAAAVRQLAQYLHDDDLVGYARAAVPPAEYARLETAWRQGHSRWPLTELPLDEKLPALLAALSASDAEKTLQQAFKAQIAGQAAGVRQAAHSLGLFGVQYLRNQGDYSDEQREHYVQLVTALSDWAMAAPLSDPKLAQETIARLTAAARDTGLNSDEALQQAGMTASLERLGPFLRAFKQVLAGYGLSLDDTAAGLRVGLVAEQGERATARVRYPLAGKELDISVALARRDRHWYVERTLQQVDALLQSADAAEAARAEEAAETAPEPQQDDPGTPAKP